jgi:hypothetical protein
MQREGGAKMQREGGAKMQREGGAKMWPREASPRHSQQRVCSHTRLHGWGAVQDAKSCES